MPELVKLTHDQDVAIITIDNPPVNAMGPGVPEGIQSAIEQVADDPSVRAIVLIGAGRTFIAGADIREFGKIVSGEKPRLTLLPYLQSIEDSPKPVVVAIHGTALGGGLETAMSGHYRVIAPTAQLGQPEVKLGLIPGAGGTQRLPRLAGPAKAAELCAFGESIGAKEALELGIADSMIEGDLLTGALVFARQIADQPAPKTRERNAKLQDTNASAAFAQLRDVARKTKRGQRAPLAAIEAVEAATQLPFEQGCLREAELFNECLFANESKASIHIFFGERTVAKIPGISKDVRLYDIKRAAVIGAGTMGGGIAMNFANAGIPVIVKETAQDALDRGIGIIRNNYATTVAKGRLSQQAMDQRMSLITPQLGYDGFEQADIIIEAVFEKMSVKKQVFSELDKVAKPEAILASNTSSLDIDEIASATSRSATGDRHAFFQSRKRDEAAGSGSRKGQRARSDRNRHGAGQTIEQNRRAGRQCARLHWQSHHWSVSPRSTVLGRRRRICGRRQPGPVRLRHGHGSTCGGRSHRLGCQLLHPAGVQAFRKGRRASAACAGPSGRIRPPWSEKRQRLVQI